MSMRENLNHSPKASIQGPSNRLAAWDRDYQTFGSKEVSASKVKAINLLCCNVPIRFLNPILAVFTVFFNVCMNVSLPVYTDAMIKAGGDPYDAVVNAGIYFPVLYFPVLFASRLFCNPSQKLFPRGSVKSAILVGFFITLNGLLSVFASPADRTPPYLQGILQTTLVPFTVIFRFLILRKGVSFQRLVCTGIVLIGIFITIEPQIWNLPGSGSQSGNGGQTGIGKVLWPMCFALGYVPIALMNVYIEKETKQKETESMVFLCWIQLFQAIFVLVGFWADFVPGFGDVESAVAFSSKLKTALGCNFSSSPDCFGVAYKSWIFIFSYCTANLFSFLLIQYAEGAVYAVIVMALVTPSATLFWTVFKPTPSFHWGPEFTMTTAFTLVGLAVITPAVVMYNYFSNKEGATSDSNTEESDGNKRT